MSYRRRRALPASHGPCGHRACAGQRRGARVRTRRAMNAKPEPKGTSVALRGTLVWCQDDPFLVGEAKAFRQEPDGLVIVHDGKIVAAGRYEALKTYIPADTAVAEYRDCLIAPGFVDTHIHFV